MAYCLQHEPVCMHAVVGISGRQDLHNRCDTISHRLLAVPAANLVAGRQDLHDRCDLMVRELGRVQDAYGNGYLGAPPLCSLACISAAGLLGLGMAARAAAAWPGLAWQNCPSALIQTPAVVMLF